jgi:hypothetical protein
VRTVRTFLTLSFGGPDFDVSTQGNDEDRIKWANDVLKFIWPKVDHATCESLRYMLVDGENAMFSKQNLPTWIEEITIKKLCFGPQVSGVLSLLYIYACVFYISVVVAPLRRPFFLLLRYMDDYRHSFNLKKEPKITGIHSTYDPDHDFGSVGGMENVQAQDGGDHHQEQKGSYAIYFDTNMKCSPDIVLMIHVKKYGIVQIVPVELTHLQVLVLLCSISL